MPGDVVQLVPLRNCPTLFVHDRRLTVGIHTTLANRGSAVWTLDETPACWTKIVLLRRRGMEVAAGDRRDQAGAGEVVAS